MFSAGFLLIILLLVAPLATYLPLAVMAALLFVVACGLIDVQRIRETMRASRSETLVLAVTFSRRCSCSSNSRSWSACCVRSSCT